MFTQPTGPGLSAAQARQLDDDFFGSRPRQYFAARIANLLASPPDSGGVDASPMGSAFAANLGVGAASDVLGHNSSDHELQLAVDAFAVRHHAAESLVRLYDVLSRGVDAHESVWNAMVDDKSNTVDLVTRSRRHLLSPEGRGSFWTFVLAPEVTQLKPQAREVTTALNVMGAWLQRAMDLLVRDDIDVNAAHNKVKHGLAIRSRDDMRVTFTTRSPNPDGNVPLEALTGPEAVDIFDRTTLQFLSRPPKQQGVLQPLEATTLRLAPEKLLAEAWMLAETHGVMFHRAAARHFAGRDSPLEGEPRLPLGPTPAQVVGNSVVGMRHPLTTLPDGTPGERGPGIAFEPAFVPLQVNFAGRHSAVVVDD